MYIYRTLSFLIKLWMWRTSYCKTQTSSTVLQRLFSLYVTISWVKDRLTLPISHTDTSLRSQFNRNPIGCCTMIRLLSEFYHCYNPQAHLLPRCSNFKSSTQYWLLLPWNTSNSLPTFTIFIKILFILSSACMQISLKAIVIHHVVAGKWTQDPWKNSQCSLLLSHLSSPPTPTFTILCHSNSALPRRVPGTMS